MNRQAYEIDESERPSATFIYDEDTSDTMARIEQALTSLTSRKRKTAHFDSSSPAVVTPIKSKKLRLTSIEGFPDDSDKDSEELSSSVPTPEELGYGKESVSSLNGDAPSPQDLGYGEESSPSPTDSDEVTCGGKQDCGRHQSYQLSPTVPTLRHALRAKHSMPPKPGMYKRRCSVTRYSLHAAQKMTAFEAASRALEKLRDEHENDGEDSIWYSLCHSRNHSH